MQGTQTFVYEACLRLDKVDVQVDASPNFQMKHAANRVHGPKYKKSQIYTYALY